MATPTPLPTMATLRLDDPAVKTAFENLTIYLSRTRDVLFDSSTTDSLGAAVAALQGRPKDIYTFVLGVPSLTGPPLLGLDAVAASTILEARLSFRVAPTASVTVSVTVGDASVGSVTVAAGALATTVTGLGPVAKDATIRPVVTTAGTGAAAGVDAVLQVRCG